MIQLKYLKKSVRKDMLIKGVLHYLVEDRNVDFLHKKILEYIDGFVMQNVLGVLTDM